MHCISLCSFALCYFLTIYLNSVFSYIALCYIISLLSSYTVYLVILLCDIFFFHYIVIHCISLCSFVIF